ncbi:MAG: DUF1064 domain-containing protein [Blastocatellia bacterium]
MRTAAADGQNFASGLEARRYEYLSLSQKAGYISELRVQVPFPIKINDQKVCEYIADFTYKDATGYLVIEDTKGHQTALSRLKIKLVEASYRVRIRLPPQAASKGFIHPVQDSRASILAAALRHSTVWSGSPLLRARSQGRWPLYCTFCTGAQAQSHI